MEAPDQKILCFPALALGEGNLLKNADIVLAVFDGSRAVSDEDKRLIGLIEGKNVIPVVNKSDLENKLDVDFLEEKLGKAAVISARDEIAAEIIGTNQSLLNRLPM